MHSADWGEKSAYFPSCVSPPLTFSVRDCRSQAIALPCVKEALQVIGHRCRDFSAEQPEPSFSSAAHLVGSCAKEMESIAEW